MCCDNVCESLESKDKEDDGATTISKLIKYQSPEE